MGYLKLSVCQPSYSQRLTAFIKPVGNKNEKELILFCSGHEEVVLKWIEFFDVNQNEYHQGPIFYIQEDVD